MGRRDDAISLVGKLGPRVAQMADPRDGWPALVEVQTSPAPTLVSLHVGPIGLSHRNRDDVERRFQNPGKNRPITVLPGTTPLLIGFWEQNNRLILVGMNAPSRIGDVTRVSLFVPLAALVAAESARWIEHFSDTGEQIIAFSPDLLPVYVDLVRSDVHVDANEMRVVLQAASDSSGEPSDERGRRAASQLIRDARFSRDVCQAYGGRCAMCELDFSLVVGAHIYPVSAPASQDEVWNGIALCQNHHAAFDSHRVFIHPGTRAISLHPTLRSDLGQSAACRAFVELTLPRLTEPSDSRVRPKTEMFDRRYSYYFSKYEWV